MMSAKKMGFTHDNKDNLSVDWYTPPSVFEALGLEFDLDPCAPKGGVPWIPAKRHFSIEDDGLAQPWQGSVWLNPPYGRFTAEWLAKMSAHAKGVALVFARTDTVWSHQHCRNASGFLFLRGRISFVDGLGVSAGSGAGAGSVLIAWGDAEARALRRMALDGLGRFFPGTP